MLGCRGSHQHCPLRAQNFWIPRDRDVIYRFQHVAWSYTSRSTLVHGFWVAWLSLPSLCNLAARKATYINLATWSRYNVTKFCDIIRMLYSALERGRKSSGEQTPQIVEAVVHRLELLCIGLLFLLWPSNSLRRAYMLVRLPHTNTHRR